MFGIPILIELGSYFVGAFGAVTLFHNAVAAKVKDGDSSAPAGSAARTIADLRGQVSTARLVALGAGAAAVGVTVFVLRSRRR